MNSTFLKKTFFLFFSSIFLGFSINKKNPPKERYNVLWLVCEDMGKWIPPFGDMTVATPNLSRLASEGIRFTNFYSTSGVCSPSRFAIATGTYPSGGGGNHMRTKSATAIIGLPKYEAVPAPEVKMFSELMRNAGYYCTNNSKQDYQFRAPVTAWDESSIYAHWRNRPEGQPFFSIFNFTQTHESGLFEPYGFKRGEQRHYNSGDRTPNKKKKRGGFSEEETTVHVSKDANFPIPPYLPDTETVRRDLWKMYNNIGEMDKQVGAILAQLEADGLLDKTIIFFYGDHGGPMPRQKRLIYDSGLNTPLIVRFPDKRNAGEIVDQLASFVDLAPTVLDFAEAEKPKYLEGQSIFNKEIPQRKYIHAAADRFDEATDAIRAVRDKRYKYIRNYRPEQPYYLKLQYREKIPTMRELIRLNEEGKLNEIQSQWFRKTKPAIELFDCIADPHEINNLAEDAKYASKIEELSKEMDRWIEEIGDQPNLPERELINQLWSGAGKQPTTAKPVVEKYNGKIKITCPTEGVSIGYRIPNREEVIKSWKVYNDPFELPKGVRIEIQAHRIGYKPSPSIFYKN